jgi:uncharacterized peroxidase-related enzyme
MALPEYEKIAQAARDFRQPALANLPLIEEGEAGEEVAALYDHFRNHFGRPDVPGILKCFATHPPLLRHMMDLSEHLIFSDGSLGRKHKEMIATLVSTQNLCAYCADSHGFFLRVHGGSSQLVAAIQADELCSPEFTAPEQVLLAFARKVNLNSHEISRDDVDLMHQSGWSEPQIAEAIHVTALFATFNRVANSFGLRSQSLLALFDVDKNGSLDESTNAERSGL